MIPYIIINGISSKSINGLLIQSLPPISKPKQRVQTEEIDGRDGDIITPLGYAAYDKQFSIGLRGDYNVDDVIDYFNTEGKITFSNEIDKYYNFKQLEQIDFAKLVKFKTANVSLHVQPFKYAAQESAKSYTYEGGTTGATINIRNSGNIYSKPTLTITGTGDIYVYLGGTQILLIELGDTSTTIIIDAEAMNAYDESGNYLNRNVTGDYNNLKLNVGLNTITISGSITAASINQYSRWI